MTAQVVNQEYLYPDTWTNLTDNASNYAAGFPDFANNVYQNWYDQPLSTGQTSNLTTAYNNMMGNAANPWISNIQGAQGAAAQAQPYMQNAANLYNQSSTYDPTEMQQFLNPYVQDANNATIAASNRNLMENVLPNVNSTFAGAGQFGSTRNADFTNRAIRDNQTSLNETLAKNNAANYTQANQNYLNWNQQGQSAASGLAGLGGQQMNYANTLAGLASQGATLTQQNLTNQMTAAKDQQQLLQSGLDKNYQDYLQQQQFPLSALASLGTSIGNMSKGVTPNQSVPVTQPDDVSKVLAVIQAMSNGLNDSSIQSILGYLGMDGFNGA